MRAKLALGDRDDRHEQEADRVADRVLRMPRGGRPSRAVRSPGPPGRAGHAGAGATVAAAAIETAGRPLSAAERGYFEPRFGYDFSRVRVHDDGAADRAARSIGARAYTLGRDVAFARGEYAPHTRAGRRLLAHELAHVAQQGGTTSPVIRRDGPEEEPSEEPSGEWAFEPIDLLVYPLIVDLWNDIFNHRVSAEVLDEIRLTGPEDAALWNAVLAVPFAGVAMPSDATFGDFLEGWVEHAEELQRIAGGSNFFLDLVSAFAGVNIESYLGSDLFLGRLRSHSASLVTVLGVAQAVVSTVAEVSEPGGEVGEFEPSRWEEHLSLVRGLLDVALKEQFTAPDFFNVGPLRLGTHPAFAAQPAAGGNPPQGLTFEHAEGLGEGQGGQRLRLGLTVNLPQTIGLFQDESADASNLQTYRGWQGSVWFNYEDTDPTELQSEMGRLPESSFRAGTIFGGRGYLGLLETGGRYGGSAEEARELTSWFVRGGFGYSGRRNQVLRRIGFDAVFTDWEERDVLAPRIGEGGEPVEGRAARITPFAQLDLGAGERHRFSATAALGFVTGTHEDFGVSDFRGDLSYIYMGDRAEGQFPQFRLDLSGSVSRLDWWNPDSPLMTGLGARAQIDRFFLGGRVHFGAGDIPESRAALLGGSEEDRVRARVPTTLLFSGGVLLGPGAGNRP